MSEELTTTVNVSDSHEMIVKSQKDLPMMAMFTLKECPPVVRTSGSLYIFNGKHYDLFDVKDFDDIFLNFCINHGVTAIWQKVPWVARAFWVYPTIPKIDEMKADDNLICLNNGVLNLDTKELYPHSHKFYFDSHVDVDYNPNATADDCPNFKKYLSTTFNNDKDTITNVLRIGGYLLDSSVKAEKMFLFDGQGSNGKSLLLKIFSMFFAKDNISALSLEKLASTGFNKELLIKSRVNLSPEQKKGNLDAEELKAIISGDTISIDRKYKITISFQPNVKIIANSNGMPTFSDKSHAIYRRMLMIPFNNCYMDQQEYDRIKNPESKNIYLKDNDLLEKIKEERSAILNLFIEGLIDLKANNYQFISNNRAIENMNAYKRDSDTVREFLEDNYEVVVDGTDKTSLRVVYDHYRYWYGRNVTNSNSLKFRSNEMGKRIREIFGVENLGQTYWHNPDTDRTEREYNYPIRLIPAPIIPVEEILTTEEATQQGIIF